MSGRLCPRSRCDGRAGVRSGCAGGRAVYRGEEKPDAPVPGIGKPENHRRAEEPGPGCGGPLGGRINRRCGVRRWFELAAARRCTLAARPVAAPYRGDLCEIRGCGGGTHICVPYRVLSTAHGRLIAAPTGNKKTAVLFGGRGFLLLFIYCWPCSRFFPGRPSRGSSGVLPTPHSSSSRRGPSWSGGGIRGNWWPPARRHSTRHGWSSRSR